MAIGKVIKGDGADPFRSDGTKTPTRPPRAGVVNAEEFEARNTARDILADAQIQAEEILRKAQDERQALMAKWQEEARQEGLASVTELLARAKLHQEELIASAEPEIVSLALAVAEKILGKDLERSPELLVELCAQTIDTARNAQQLLLRVHPTQAQLLRANLPKLLDQLGGAKLVTIKEDPQIIGGGCVLETPIGTFDAQISTQLMVLRQLLLDEGRKGGG